MPVVEVALQISRGDVVQVFLAAGDVAVSVGGHGTHGVKGIAVGIDAAQAENVGCPSANRCRTCTAVMVAMEFPDIDELSD